MTTMPCPGLTYQADHQIARYLGRTMVHTGGAPSRRVLADVLFPSLAGTTWPSLTDSQQRMVIHREEALAAWRNSRALNSVFSTKCEDMVYTAVSAPNPLPCQKCRELYENHTFQVALRRPMPREENMKHVPKAYRCPQLGEIYLKYHGVRQLLEKVSTAILLCLGFR
jgi:hypothetical protein